jgi:hypothetical protein
MPGLFYFLFEGTDTDVELVTVLMASYAMWAILGVAFFQFGVGIAEERGTPWERFLRALPLPAVSGWPGGCCRPRPSPPRRRPSSSSRPTWSTR